MKTVWYADCDEFDNCRTGYYHTEAEAIEAFQTETELFLSEAERKQARMYTRSVLADRRVIRTAWALADRGTPSPALNAEMALEHMCYRYAVANQGFAGTVSDWCQQSDYDREQYELGAAGVPTDED
jgi:hypothetical protein